MDNRRLAVAQLAHWVKNDKGDDVDDVVALLPDGVRLQFTGKRTLNQLRRCYKTWQPWQEPGSTGVEQMIEAAVLKD